ncbi:MAG: ABC transporter ATP-binding protein [Dehalococcoidia bacterium]
MEIRLDGVRVERGARTVLDVPELVIRSGVVTAILGPNGAGKTTLLRAIAGLDRPAAGSILIGDRPVANGRVSFAFQRAVFVSGTVGQNLQLALRLRGIPSLERDRRVAATAEELGVGHLLGRDVRRLSGGEAQRVNLARALVLDDEVLLLDEPLAGLDAPSRESLLQELPATLRSRPRTTVALVTHDRDEAARLADDVVLLIDGRVHSAGSLQAVFSRPEDAESARFLGWTIVDWEGAVAGIAPGSLAVGTGEVEFSLEVEAIIPAGSRWEAVGRIGGSPARVGGDGPRPQAGPLTVSARRPDLLRLDGGVNVKNTGRTIGNR